MTEDNSDLSGVKTPPANLEAEQALLGALLTNNAAYDRVSDFLSPHHFADQINGQIYKAIARRIEAGHLADPVTMKSEFTELLADHGGMQYILDLVGAMVGIINARDYAYIIHDCWIRRELVDIGSNIVNTAFTSTSEVKGANQIETAEASLFLLANDKEQGNATFTDLDKALHVAIESANKAFKAGGEIVGLTTGFKDLDKKIGGLHKSDLIILAGRPGMGKTALAVNIAFNAAQSLRADSNRENEKPKGTVAFFSLEMSSEQLGLRILSDQAEISGDRIRRGDINGTEFARLSGAVSKVAHTPLHINDTPALPVSALRAHCRRLKRTVGLDLVVVDYLQLLRPATTQRSENRVQEISSITQALKALAKELEVPVIALSQLSRRVEEREDKRPNLSDLRESGSIEQDADIVMFVYRDAYYAGLKEPSKANFANDLDYQTALTSWLEKMNGIYNEADLIIEKQRHGPTGTVKLNFIGEFARFTDRPQSN